MLFGEALHSIPPVTNPVVTGQSTLDRNYIIGSRRHSMAEPGDLTL